MTDYAISNQLLLLTYQLLESIGIASSQLKPVSTVCAVAVALAAALLLYWILSVPLASIINHKIEKSNTLVDDYLFPKKTIHTLCVAFVTLIATSYFPSLFDFYPNIAVIAKKVLIILNILTVSYSIILIAKGFCDYLNYSESGKGGSLVLRNLVSTIVSSVAALLIISIILNRDLAYVISGLGAMAAVLMLVFKDSILGMTAGIRLSVNKLLKVNDWVSVPKYNAEGRVEDLTLTSIKIRNWDQSLTSIPPHALISDGFTNHEAMLEQGIRQIRRTFNVDVNSVRILSIDELKPFRGAEWGFGIDMDVPQVNLTLFRKWLRNEMINHPRHSSAPRLFVKEHPHTPNGVPIEIHFFVRCVDWAEFEELQADFLDRVIASFHLFHLHLFQSPAGLDFKASDTSVKKYEEKVMQS